jgi:hypothetical protein
MISGRFVGVIASAVVGAFCPMLAVLTANAAVPPHQLAQRHGGWMAENANPKHACMYVASGLSDPILIYDLGSPFGPRKLGEITDGLTKPAGIAVDGQGTLYAPNHNEGQPGGTERSIRRALRAPASRNQLRTWSAVLGWVPLASWRF